MTMEKNLYDILPTQSNINAYNRYPFKSYEDAVNNLKQKTLQPGEMAVGYYFDQNTVIGINAVFAFGNLKRTGNIIFKNGDIFDGQINHINDMVFKQRKVINQLVDSVNHTNKAWAGLENDLNDLKNQFQNTVQTQHIELIDLDNYDLDLD